MEIINALAQFPLGSLFLLIGFIMISVRFGLELRVLIDVKNMNKNYALVVGIVCIIIGIVLYLPDSITQEITNQKDPFLTYYAISVLLFLIGCWVVLNNVSGRNQVQVIKYIFLFIGFVVAIVVIWRGMDIYAYMSNPIPDNIPLALYERHNYLIYIVLLGIGMAVSFWIISAGTRKESNVENKVPIYKQFALLYIYFMFCRFVWELVDWIARIKIPKP